MEFDLEHDGCLHASVVKQSPELAEDCFITASNGLFYGEQYYLSSV